MASFLAAFGDLFASFYELITAMLTTIVNIFQGILNAIIGFFTGIVSLLGNTLGGVADIVSGLGKFVVGKSPVLCAKGRLWAAQPDRLIGNIVIIAIVVAAGLVFLRFSQTQPRPASVAKKTS
jgi:hypothetical protein